MTKEKLSKRRLLQMFQSRLRILAAACAVFLAFASQFAVSMCADVRNEKCAAVPSGTNGAYVTTCTTER
jgi:hypothetical protein